MSRQGGAIGITIDWNCDLDWRLRHCKPVYEFHRLNEEKNLAQGFNFRCLPGPTGAPALGVLWALLFPEPSGPSRCPREGSTGAGAAPVVLGLTTPGASREQDPGGLSPCPALGPPGGPPGQDWLGNGWPREPG